MTTTPRAVSSRIQANTTDVGPGMSPLQRDGKIVGLGDGGYVVVWVDESLAFNTGGLAVIGQKFNALGQKVGGEVRIVHPGAEGEQHLASVTRRPDGGFAVAYVDRLAGDSDIYVRIYDANFNFLRQDDVDLGAANTISPSITSFANGSYVVASTLGSDIIGRIVSPAGAIGTAFTIQDAEFFSGSPQVATLSNGSFVVVYEDQFDAAGNDIDIKFRIFSSTGAPVNPASGNNGLSVAGAGDFENERFPDVAALKGGGFVVVWEDETTETDLDIRATVYDNAGAFVANNILVNTTTSSHQDEASVVALEDGGFVVIWEDLSLNTVRGQRFAANGSKIGGEYAVQGSRPVFDSPDVALLYDGRIVDAITVGDDVTWRIWDPRNRPSDFNDDGFGDILWRNASTGQVATWELNGAGGQAFDGYGAAGSAWQQVAAHDFNGDGRSDILWRNTSTGQVATWELNGAGGFAFDLYGAASAAWQSIGAGDFNADSKGDILFRNASTGAVATWELNGAGGFAFDSYGAASLVWKIAGIGDFNADGKDDILWRNSSTGQVQTWELNGAGGISVDSYGAAGLAWHIFGVGDFNADGKDDILWRNSSTGQVATWELNGSGAFVVDNYGAAGQQWEIENTADYNRDGLSDILWRNTSTGQIGVWELNGAGGFSFQAYGATSLNWQIFDGNFQFV